MLIDKEILLDREERASLPRIKEVSDPVDLIDSLGRRYGRSRVLLPVFATGVGCFGVAATAGNGGAVVMSGLMGAVLTLRTGLELGVYLVNGVWPSDLPPSDSEANE